MKKRLLSLALTVCMVLTLLPTAALAADTPETLGDFSVTYDASGTAPTYSDGVLTFDTAGEYTIGMAEGKTSTSDVIVVSATEVTLNLDGLVIEAPYGTDTNGANALTAINGTVLNITADSSLTGGIGTVINPMGNGNGNGGSGVVGNVTITGAATLTAIGGIGGSAIGGTSGAGGAGIIGNVTAMGMATLTATGGIGGTSAMGTSGTGGAGISGNVAATDSASLIAIGGQYGGGIANGGNGISGSLTVTGHATVSLEGGLASSTPGSALTGTLTATGFIIKGGFTGLTDDITGGSTYLNQYRYISVEPASAEADPLSYTIAVDTPLKIEVLPIYGNPVGDMIFSTHGFTQPTDGSKTAELYWGSDKTVKISYGDTGCAISPGFQDTIYFYATEPGTYTFTATFIDDSKTTSNYIITVNVTETPSSRYPVSGTVIAGGIIGADVSELTVHLYDSEDTTFSTSVGSATTDGGGAYTISGVPNGSYVARVAGSSGSYAASSSGTITVSDAPVDNADITLMALTTKSIAVTSASHKITYKVGDTLDVAKLKITVTRSDDSAYEEAVTADMVDGFNSSAVAASQTLTITFNGKKATYNISISRADYNGSVAPAPTLSGKTDTNVSLNAVTVTGQSVEYGKNTSDTTPSEWQDGTTFTGLTANTAYYFFARIQQTDTIEAGGVSTALIVTTKTVPVAPDAPTIGTGENRPTSSSIAIDTVTGNEYYISTSDTADWGGTLGGYFKVAENGIHRFESLSPATQYYIYVRVAETDDAMPSASACTAQYTLPTTPSASVVTVNFTAETISFANTYEVSVSETFAALIFPGGEIQPGTTYYVRVTAASGVPASEAVNFTTAARPTAPEAVTAANITKTDATITILGTVATQEYSVDSGTTWQPGNDSSLTFTDLTANHAYSVVTRIPATVTTFASDNSAALAVTTKAAASAAPDAPTIGTGEDKSTSVSITINTVTGNEYYISTSASSDWSGTPSGYFKAAVSGMHKFESLSPATQYYIHVRAAETDDAMPSASAYTAQYALPATPLASVVTINYMEETMSFGGAYEVSGDPDFLDNGKVIVSGSTVRPGTTYYVRVKAASGVPASEAVSFTTETRPAAPDAVTAANITKTDTAITVTGTVSTQEYSVDGTNWVTGNESSLIFTGLTANHAYSVVTRILATATTFASANSTALSVTTKAAASAAPSSGVTYSVKDGTVTGLGDTYEYNLNGGSTWQTAPVTGVAFTVGNVIQVRTRETDTAMPSLPQTLGTIAVLVVAPDYAIDFINEKTAVSVPATVEYNTSSAGAETWTTGTGAPLALTPGTTCYFRTAATDAALAGNVQTLAVPARPAAPDVTVITIAEGSDASHTVLTLADTYEYILAAVSPTVSMSGASGTGSAAEVETAGGQHIYVRIKAVANTSFSSDWTDCGVVRLGVNDIVLTGVGYDVAAGKLTGTTDNMEYQVADGTWTACTSPDTAGVVFAAGTVRVRQKDKTANEHTVGTIAAAAVSSAPTLGNKAYSSITLTPMADYEYSRDGGITWQDSNIFSGLGSGTAYSFVARIKATAGTLPGTTSAALSVTTNDTPQATGGTIAPITGAPVIVDGKTQNIGTEKKSGNATTVTVDQSKLGENISSAAAGSSVVVPVTENSAATASLVVKNIEDMAAKGMTLSVRTGNVAYNLDTSAIDTAALASAFPGADMSRVPFDVTIKNSSAAVAGETLVLSPVEFTITAAYNGRSVSVDIFSAYIDRVIEVTAAQAAKITTAVVVNADGSTRHVPTNVIEKDGKYYAVINSRTNSTYVLIQNEIRFADSTGKWYEATVNEMGSRKIIEGRSASVFDGEAGITRAEFAAILVRALGLPADGTSTFSDVPASAWYTGAVATAVQYGLIDGRGNNRFEPNAAITRQEVMLMLQRAAALTEFTGTASGLDSFTDADSVGSWARDAAKWSVGSGLIQGADGKLNPTANITRAESAAIILRLLQKAGLVDMRS